MQECCCMGSRLVDKCLLWKEWSLSDMKGWVGEGQPFGAGDSGDRPEWTAVST